MTQTPQGSGPVALEWPGDVRDLPTGAGWLGLAALAVALVGALAWWWCRRAAVAPVGVALPAPPPPPPTAAALLAALAMPGDAASAAAFAAEVKRLVRLHVRERFGFAAFAATSEELQRALPQAPGLAPCLSACDAVLFAAASLRAEPAPHQRAPPFAIAPRDGRAVFAP
ncbi:MAG: hypothetical protein ACK6D2_10645 [Planctomycetota bacterium]